MTNQGEFQIAIPGITELDIVFTYSTVIDVKTFTEVVISLHIGIVKKDILYEITDKISCPVKWGGVFIIVKIIIEINIQFFDILTLDVMINTISDIHKDNNTNKCGAVKVTMYAGHKNRL